MLLLRAKRCCCRCWILQPAPASSEGLSRQQAQLDQQMHHAICNNMCTWQRLPPRRPHQQNDHFYLPSLGQLGGY